MSTAPKIKTDDLLSFLKQHQIGYSRTIGRLVDDLFNHGHDQTIDLYPIIVYGLQMEIHPRTDNDFRDWFHQDVQIWLKTRHQTKISV